MFHEVLHDGRICSWVGSPQWTGVRKANRYNRGAGHRKSSASPEIKTPTGAHAQATTIENEMSCRTRSRPCGDDGGGGGAPEPWSAARGRVPAQPLVGGRRRNRCGYRSARGIRAPVAGFSSPPRRGRQKRRSFAGDFSPRKNTRCTGCRTVPYAGGVGVAYDNSKL